ncbi:MAG TPA: pilus assembly protein TadG-related protein [Candidatus Limnocylindrales bacterium]|jgi:Flp pilus assembly protein TadG
MIGSFLRRRARSSDRERSRGQALALFAIASVLLVGMVAVVIDVAWFWTNEQSMQKAADAGALAGAVYLPGDIPSAYSAARAEATKNGYTSGVNGVTVTPQQDATNSRRLRVTITGPVQAFFARVFCVVTSCTNQITETVKGVAEFTLPVPMGSPQNYYGVGTYVYNTITTNHSNNNADTGFVAESSYVSGTGWTNPGNASTNDNNYTTTATNGRAQTWYGFGLQTAGVPNDGTLSIDGIEVQLADVYYSSGSGGSSGCTVKVEISWNGGTSWSTAQNTSALNTTTTTDKTVGSNSSTSSWGSHSWAYSDFSNSNFRVRLTWTNGTSTCGTSRQVNLDQLLVRVTYHTVTTTTTSAQNTGSVTSPTGGSLTSQGFWGAVITRGGSRENGDQFSPYNDNSSISGHTSTNPDYSASGYDYTVVLPGGSGQVKIFDATFCETGSNGSGGNMGAGDHWIGGSANGVTTVYQLWNENNTPYDTTDDTLVATSGTTFANEIQADYSGVMGTPSHSGLTDCASNPYHNAWYTLATGLSAGRYRVNVNTSSSNNNSTNAENMFSLWVTSSGSSPQIYGEGKMVAYNNLVSGNQLFYLAQIGAENAGKTMEITLFDPGDVSGNAYLRIKSPNGNAYNYATFSWTADNGTSGTNVTSIQTASSGGSFFNDRVITIDVALPSTYGSTGLTPPGETQAGWWKIEYQVSGGNDTTTWQVGIRGSPVHLIVP